MNLNKLFKKEAKYVVVFCVIEANTFNFISSKAIKPDTTKIQYGDKKVFIVDLENPTYRKGKTRFFCMDINAEQIHFKRTKENESVSPRVHSMILEDSIIEQLARATTIAPKVKFDIIALIIGLSIGALIGFIIKIFVPLPGVVP